MKKVLILTILLICSCIVNAIENETYKSSQYIVVYHNASKQRIINDWLYEDDIKYTKTKIIKYVKRRIPREFHDKSESYTIYVTYIVNDKSTITSFYLYNSYNHWFCQQLN